MGLLARGTLVALVMAGTACYSPDLRDCTVACKTAGDCADSQVCGADQFCASPDVAGRCSTGGARRDASIGASTEDGGTPIDGAIPPDAPPDAPTEGVLTISIGGHGRVIVQNVGTCEFQASPCQYVVPLDQDVILAAFPSNGWELDEWNAGPCTGNDSPACVFPPSLTMVAGAKFKRD